MAFTKDYLYDPTDQEISLFAKALSHPARLSILRMLNIDGTCSVEKLSMSHPLSQPSISQHLRILRKSGLVGCKERTPYTDYWLDREYFQRMKMKLGIYLDGF